jgi:N6-L-threonylcarbamoyladenine synthase
LNPGPVHILSIETSCDDTAAAVVCDGQVLSSTVSSQLVHAAFGGVVPELASRAHQRNIVPIVRSALEQSQTRLEDLQAIAVTQGPGLAGALLVGISFAKALAFARGLPIIEVNHLEGHVYSVFADQTGPPFPFLALVVSGGHTELVRVDDWFDLTVLGRTRDDAAGEAFDKVGKLFGLDYPGGPEIDRRATHGDPSFHDFPVAQLDGYDFSFSGIKTSALYFLNRFEERERLRILQDHLPDLCAAFQAAVVEMLTGVLDRAIQDTGIRSVALTGGVAANSGLRSAAESLCQRHSARLFVPRASYRTDNAAMIGVVAYRRLLAGTFGSLAMTADPSARLSAPKEF